MRVSSTMKNAGKACNNRLYRHIRTFEKIIKNYFVIFSKYTIPVQISEAASSCRRSASYFHNAVYSVFRTCRKILIFYRKPGFYRSLCRYPFPSFSGKPDLSIFQRSRARSCGSSILSFRCAAPLFCHPFTG